MRTALLDSVFSPAHSWWPHIPKRLWVTDQSEWQSFRSRESWEEQLPGLSIMRIPGGRRWVMNPLGPEGWAGEFPTTGGRGRNSGEVVARRLGKCVWLPVELFYGILILRTRKIKWIENLITMFIKKIEKKCLTETRTQKVKHFKNYTLVP